MLGKLFKYEWKDTWKVCTALLAFGAVMTVVTGLVFQAPGWRAVFFGTGEPVVGMGPLGIFTFMTVFLYIFTLVGVSWGILIYQGVHFYRTMYTEEGYLTHTLPVTSHQLLVSKLLNAVCWYLIMLVCMLLSVFVMMFSIIALVVSGNTDVTLWEVFTESLGGLGASLTEEAAGIIIFYVLQLIIGTFSTIMILFGSVTLGQLSKRHKVMMSIVSYFAVSVGINIISNIIILPLTFRYTMHMIVSEEADAVSGIYPISWVVFLIQVAAAVVLYFVSSYIIRKKLNLE